MLLATSNSVYITDVHEAKSFIINHNQIRSLRTADAFPVVASLPPKNSYFRTGRSDDRKCVCYSQAAKSVGK